MFLIVECLRTKLVLGALAGRGEVPHIELFGQQCVTLTCRGTKPSRGAVCIGDRDLVFPEIPTVLPCHSVPERSLPYFTNELVCGRLWSKGLLFQPGLFRETPHL